MDITILELINKGPEELERLKKRLIQICEIIDFIISKKITKETPKPKPKTEEKKISNKTGRKKFPEKVEKLMIEVIEDHPNGKMITELHRILEKKCLENKWKTPSLPTFTRRYHKYHKNKPDLPLEKVPIGKLKEQYRLNRTRQEKDLENKGFIK